MPHTCRRGATTRTTRRRQFWAKKRIAAQRRGMAAWQACWCSIYCKLCSLEAPQVGSLLSIVLPLQILFEGLHADSSGSWTCPYTCLIFSIANAFALHRAAKPSLLCPCPRPIPSARLLVCACTLTYSLGSCLCLFGGTLSRLWTELCTWCHTCLKQSTSRHEPDFRTVCTHSFRAET